MTHRRFIFTLEPLRAVRQHAELMAMQELARELDRAAAIQRELEAAQTRMAGARAAAVPAPVTTAAELASRQSYLERVERELEESRLRDSVQAASVEESRTRVQDAARERETLDRVAAKRRVAHNLESARQERTANDQIALLMRGPGLGEVA